MKRRTLLLAALASPALPLARAAAPVLADPPMITVVLDDGPRDWVELLPRGDMAVSAGDTVDVHAGGVLLASFAVPAGTVIKGFRWYAEARPDGSVGELLTDQVDSAAPFSFGLAELSGAAGGGSTGR